ncbi:hypothetical protein FOCC_FOCC016707, partial [Frankliniella occidentalis]
MSMWCAEWTQPTRWAWRRALRGEEQLEAVGDVAGQRGAAATREVAWQCGAAGRRGTAVMHGAGVWSGVAGPSGLAGQAGADRAGWACGAAWGCGVAWGCGATGGCGAAWWWCRLAGTLLPFRSLSGARIVVEVRCATAALLLLNTCGLGAVGGEEGFASGSSCSSTGIGCCCSGCCECGRADTTTGGWIAGAEVVAVVVVVDVVEVALVVMVAVVVMVVGTALEAAEVVGLSVSTVLVDTSSAVVVEAVTLSSVDVATVTASMGLEREGADTVKVGAHLNLAGVLRSSEPRDDVVLSDAGQQAAPA